MNFKYLARPAVLIAAVALAGGLTACNDDSPPVASFSGTAAVGVPLASASVSAQCAVGEALTTTTGASGSYSISLSGGQTFPCFVTVTGGSPGVTLHAVAQAEGNVNVTPLTELIIAAATGMDPTAWYTANKGTLAASLAALAGKLPAAQTALVATLKASGYTVPAGNLNSVSFAAVDGDAYDDLLEALKVSLANAGKTFAELVTVIASSGTGTTTLPFTDEITVAEVAAMPQLNSSTLSISGGVLKMKTNVATGTPGAYVGGGSGNKAVLQLPGFNGMKLKDFKDMAIELKALSPEPVGSDGKPYVSVNIMIELDCTAAPLSSTATVAEVQARRRLLTFDPFYKFIQEEPNAITSTEFKTITFTPATGGWRISAGAVAGNDTGVEEVEHGTQYNLTTFNHAAYPNACIVDGISADNGMFRDTSKAECNTGTFLAPTAPGSCGKAHTGVFLFLGSSGNSQLGDWDVKRVRLNDRTFTFK